jgi:hypothetical protein
MAVGMGQSAAQNPNASVGGQGGLGLNHWDPIGNWITSKGGDPYNLYGHKDNPGALFFPSSDPNSLNGGAGMGMPAPSGNIHPFLYDPSSFVKRPMGGGFYNDMAAGLAGPMYDTRLMKRPVPMGGQHGPAPGDIESTPGMYGGLEPGFDRNDIHARIAGAKGAKGGSTQPYMPMMKKLPNNDRGRT